MVIHAYINIPYFFRRTKKHITDVLTQTEKENPEANAHVAYVLKALQSVLAFEVCSICNDLKIMYVCMYI